MLADHGVSVMSVVDRPRRAVRTGLLRVWRDWAGVPRGPLGWVSTHTVLNASTVVFRNVAEASRLCDDDVLLDLGCGAGGFLAGQAGHVQQVAGIDLSELQVGLARKTLGERIAAGTAEIVHGDAAQLPWPDATFTVVTCMQVFEVFPDPEQVVAEVFRVLRPGGRAVLNIGERVPDGTRTHREWGAIMVWAEDDVRAMLEDAGFTEVTIQYVAWGGNSPVERLFAKVAGPIGGDLRLVRGIKPLPTGAHRRR